MMLSVKKLEKSIRRSLGLWLSSLGLHLVRSKRYNQLVLYEKELLGLRSLLLGEGDRLSSMLTLTGQSKSQIFQDMFALSVSNFKRDGFFVEFGATNGSDISNTFLLENRYGWRGILAEPARCWHDQLRKNRSCIVDTRCVWTRSGEQIEFNETASPELSTVSDYSESDHHKSDREKGTKYFVETVSLIDLLRLNGAPPVIDYLSIDTEGSEFDILNSFDFSAYHFSAITVEHNRSANRDRIADLLIRNNYRRIKPDVSTFEDWYVFSGV